MYATKLLTPLKPLQTEQTEASLPKSMIEVTKNAGHFITMSDVISRPHDILKM